MRARHFEAESSPSSRPRPWRFAARRRRWSSFNRADDSPAHARTCLGEFRQRYNERRPHWALIPEEGGDPVTPHEVYVDGLATQLPSWQGWARAARKKLDRMLETAA